MLKSVRPETENAAKSPPEMREDSPQTGGSGRIDDALRHATKSCTWVGGIEDAASLARVGDRSHPREEMGGRERDREGGGMANG